MSYQQGGGYNNGGGGGQQPRQKPRMPQPGWGNLRHVQKTSDKSPVIRGYANIDGRMIQVSIWVSPAKQASNGQWIPEGLSAKFEPYNGEYLPPIEASQQQPPQRGYPPQQQGFNYGQQPPQQGYAPQQGYPQQGQAPQHHAPPPPQHAPQHTQQYQPAQQHAPPPPQYPPQGYQPAPQAGPPPQYPPRQQAANYGDPGATFQREEIPF